MQKRVVQYLLNKGRSVKVLTSFLVLCAVVLSTVKFGYAQSKGGLLINEVSYGEFRYTDGEGDYGMPWIEIKNNSAITINTAGYQLVHDDTSAWTLPAVDIEPFAYYFIWLTGKDKVGSNGISHSSFTLNPAVNKLELLSPSTISDSVTIYAMPPWNGTYGRCDENSDTWCYFPVPTPKYSNVTIGLWENITTAAQFYPRDSSPNASLFYKGKFWVFEGWKGGGGEEMSFSNVWSSLDGTFWLSVNPSPPFDAYSSYIVFQDKMWAFANEIYNSTDGVTWTKVASGMPFHRHNRVVEFNGKLLIVKDKKIWESADGIEWTLLTDQAPWIAREFPGFHFFNNKLWFFGGGINYKTPQEAYLNDVWVSDDAINWNLVTENAPWIGRYWFTSIVFDSKLWMMGGWRIHDWLNKDYGNRNDVWFTEDGVRWNQLISSNIWYPRHAMFAWTNNEQMYVSSGYYNPLGLQNDVWKIEKFNNINPEVFYLKPESNLNLLGSWGTRADGSGLQPKGFNFDFQKFFVCNADSIQIKSGWNVGGYNSTVTLGFNSKPLHVDILGEMPVSANLILGDSVSIMVEPAQVPVVKRASASSEIVVKPLNGAAAMPLFEVGSLRIEADSAVLQSPLVVKKSLSFTGGRFFSDQTKIQYADSASLTLNVGTGFTNLSHILPGEHAPSKISINAAGQLRLDYDVETDTVELLSGKVIIDDATLTSAVIQGASRERYFVTENNGSLATLKTAQGFYFPIGTAASYNPLRIVPIDSLNGAFVEANVTPIDTLSNGNCVNVLWEISGTSLPGKNYDVELSWDSINTTNLGHLGSVSLTEFSGKRWEEITNSRIVQEEDQTFKATGRSAGNGFFAVQELTRQSEFAVIYPNPAVHNLNISFDELTPEDVVVELVDLTGRLMYRYWISSGVKRHQKQLPAELQEGSYVVRIKAGRRLNVYHLNIFER